MSIFRVDGERLKGAAPLVEGWEETMLDSCLLGIMGEVYTDRLETLDAAPFLTDDGSINKLVHIKLIKLWEE